MPFTSGVLNPYGTVQAGAMIWLADVTASVLALEGQTIEENGKGAAQVGFYVHWQMHI